MKFDWLEPRYSNILLTLLILSLPIFSENVPLENGGSIVEKFIPMHITYTYLHMKDYIPFLQMVGFSFVVYIGVTLIIQIAHSFKKSK